MKRLKRKGMTMNIFKVLVNNKEKRAKKRAKKVKVSLNFLSLMIINYELFLII